LNIISLLLYPVTSRLLNGLHAISSATRAISFPASREVGPDNLHTEMYAHVRAMTVMPFPFFILRNNTGRQFVCIITTSYHSQRNPKISILARRDNFPCHFILRPLVSTCVALKTREYQLVIKTAESSIEADSVWDGETMQAIPRMNEVYTYEY